MGSRKSVILVLKLAVVLFFITLPFGQLGGFMFNPGIVVYLHDLFILPILGFALHSTRASPGKLYLQKAITWFILICAASLMVNRREFSQQELFLSSLYLVRWVLYAGLYVAVTAGIIKEFFWIMGIYAVSVVVALLGFVQYIYYPTLRNMYYLGWDEHYYRLFSTFLDPNFVGLFIALGFILGLYIVLTTIDRRRKFLVFMCQLILFIALLLTYSRSSFIGFATGIIVYLIIYRKVAMFFVFLTVFFVSASLLPTRGRDILKITREESALARLGSWQHSINLFWEKPVLGHGFNTLRFIQLKRGYVSDEPFISRSASGVDNSILFVSIATGSIGAGVYIFILYKQLLIGISLLNSIKNKALGAAYVATLGALVSHSMFVNSLFYPWIILWIWVLTGVAERKLISDKLLADR